MPLMLEIRTGRVPTPKSLRQFETITNTPDRQRLRRFVNEHSLLIHTQHIKVKDKHLLGYSVSHWFCDFTFDPSRSRSLYSTHLVTSECQRAIEAFIATNSGFYPKEFFVRYDEISEEWSSQADASRLLEHGSDSNDLLLFLQYLSEIHWLDIYIQGSDGRYLTNGIIQWVCTTLVS